MPKGLIKLLERSINYYTIIGGFKMKQRLKAVIAFATMLVMLVSVMPLNAMSVDNGSYEHSCNSMIADTRGTPLTLAQLRAKFPNGKYWNHAGSSSNNQDGYTSTPCEKHVGSSASTCNAFAPNGTNLSWQCMGYAEKLGYDSTGFNSRVNANGWYTNYSSSALDSLKAGDIVRYSNDGHSIFVTAVNGDTVTYTDCNSDWQCVIRWDKTISKSTLRSSFTYVRVSPGLVASSYNLDLNGYLDNTEVNNLSNYGTVDLYINGNKVLEDGNDYCTEWVSGTQYEFKDIKPNAGYSYDGIQSGNRSGTINSTTSLRLSFSRNDFSRITETPERIVYNGHTYAFYSTPVTWYFAKEYCETLGGHLVAIADAAENEFVKSLIPLGTKTWMGATDNGTEGTWRWVTGETFDYSSWASGEPNNTSYESASSQDFASFNADGEWCDSVGCTVYAFVLEIDGFDHEHYLERVAENVASCTGEGNIEYWHCTGCGKYYSDAAGNTEIAYEDTILDAVGHDFVSLSIFATCIQPAGTLKACSRCEYSFITYPDSACNDWSTEYPEGIAENLIETCMGYRFRDYQITTSYSPTMPGWTLTDFEWEQSETGTIDYVASWNSGFSTSHNLYITYHKTPKTAFETETQKLTVDSTQTIGYIYWHWCRGTYENGPINRQVRTSCRDEFTTFHAFFSTTSPSSLTLGGYDEGETYYQYSNANCCTDTYWYYSVPVKRQQWTSYDKLFTYGQWSEWSEWSTDAVTASSTREVETTTLYRYAESGFGDHVWGDGFETTTPSIGHEGEMTYVCTLCGATRTEIIPALEGHNVTFLDWDGTVISEQQVLHGTSATAPENPTREGYTFIGWSRDFTNVTEDIIVIAMYETASTPTPSPTPIPTPTPTPTISPEPIESAVNFTVENVRAQPGEDITVVFAIEGDYSANALTAYIYFDSDKLSLNANPLTMGEVWMQVAMNGGAVSTDTTGTAGRIGFAAASPVAFSGNGTIFTINFHVNEDVELGTEISLRLKIDQFAELSENDEVIEIPYNIYNGCVLIPSFTPGDVNGDGKVEAIDAVLVLRHILNPRLSGTSLLAADYSGDGKIDAIDAVLILRSVIA